MEQNWKFGILKSGGKHYVQASDGGTGVPVLYVQTEDGSSDRPTVEPREAWIGRRVRYLDRGGYATHLSLADAP